VAISVHWGTKVITVEQSDLTLVSGDLYELDANAFRLALKALEDDADGIAHDDTHRHTTEVVLGGITYARFVEIINDYTLEIEDGNYRVRVAGANTNLADVYTNTSSSPTMLTNNSAGLIVVNGAIDATAVADAVWNALIDNYNDTESTGFALRLLRQMVAGKAAITGKTDDGGILTVFEADDSVMATFVISNNQLDMDRTS